MPSPVAAEFVAKLQRVHLLSTVAELLSWDEQVNLPPGSANQRAEQLALLAELHHAAASDARLGALLAERELPATRLTAEEQVVVRQARRDYDRVTKLPADFVREKATHSSHAYHAWAQAKAKSDFANYAPFLEKHLELAKREADFLGQGSAPYDYFIDQNDPGMTTEVIGGLFAGLKRELVTLVRAILATPVKRRTNALRGFPVEGQKVFLREVTERLGFDYGRGRLDVSLHPFCSGAGADTRLTTRFNVDKPLDALFSSIHETGHGLYEQGLPPGHAGTALGMHAGMAVHESQSRLWENQVGRGRAFWRCFEPRFREIFPAQTAALSQDELHLIIHEVARTPIRVESDEVTYNLHIILRFELERSLFSGELAVRDLPAAWREATGDLLGLEPANDREGVLQDIHWSGGAFGYFPSYCLGNMMAAQLWYGALAALPGLEDDFASGNFSRLLDWLRKNIHAQGRRRDLRALVLAVTGEELSPKHLVRYLRERYGALYLK
ncbi:MAG: carboxypeptidase M32 [Opitutaceae bacterium]|nr:carboxypeptidase M32 [Opitutaceae bacterium]